jgi:hypothetical protein
MKRLMTVTALAALVLAPLTAVACDEYDEAMATATPPASMASTAPAASKAPVSTIAKASVAKSKQKASKPVAKAGDAKVAAATAN